MVEALGTLRGGSIGVIDRQILATVREVVLPALVALLFLFALTATLGRAGALRSWSADHSGSGEFLVSSCAESLSFGSDQWNCEGEFTAAGQRPADGSQLVTSLGAYSSQRPYVGQRYEVFFRTAGSNASDETTISKVYPAEYQLNELARLYISLIPRLLLMIGALLWLAGWFSTRNLDRNDLIANDSIRFPQRFGWQARGITWMAASVGVFALGYLVTTRLIGSLGII